MSLRRLEALRGGERLKSCPDWKEPQTYAQINLNRQTCMSRDRGARRREGNSRNSTRDDKVRLSA